MIRLSIIIVSWNTADFLKNCLKSIFENPPNIQFEVIVVDNNSDYDICQVKEAFPDIRLIRNTYNYGFGVGTNIGFRISSGKYVMTLNPDTVLFPGTIDRLITTLDENDDVGIAVPVMKDVKVSRQQFAFIRLFFNSAVLRKFRDIFVSSKNPEETESFDVKFIGGTGYICRVSALREGGVFSEDNFLFGEEYYLCRQMAEKGYKIRIVPAARFEHHVSVTFKDDPARLSMAAKLGSAVGWRIRKEQWGDLLGFLSGSLLFMENTAKWAIMVLIGPFVRRKAVQRSLILSQCRSIVLAYGPMVMDEDKYLAEVNEMAEIFFNGGRKPKRPPVFQEVTGRLVPSHISSK